MLILSLSHNDIKDFSEKIIIRLFTEIFTDDRKNTNGCPIKGTFYISHQYTNYRDVQYLWNTDHEIAAHSVT